MQILGNGQIGHYALQIENTDEKEKSLFRDFSEQRLALTHSAGAWTSHLNKRLMSF